MNSAYFTVRGTSIVVVDQAGKVLETIPCGNAPAAGKLLAILTVAAPAIHILHYPKPDYQPTARSIAQLLTARPLV